ncbi:MAG: hypothetical protein ACUVTZ_14355 [Armatimonadota bacterium]
MDPCWTTAPTPGGVADFRYSNLVAEQILATIDCDEIAIYVAFDALDSQPVGVAANDGQGCAETFVALGDPSAKTFTRREGSAAAVAAVRRTCICEKRS